MKRSFPRDTLPATSAPALLALLAFAGVATGCATTTRAPVTGLIFNGTKAGELVTEASDASKSGRSCAHSVLGAVAWGDASLDSAKKAGGISTVSAVDGENFSVLGAYARYCLVVTGR